MAVGDVVRLRTRGTLLGSRVEFGVHLRYETIGADAADLCGSWVANIMPLVLAATSNECNWDSLLVSDTNPTGQESFTFELTQPNPGTAGGDALPPQDAAVISLRSGIKGGRRRGRMYVPGLTEIGNNSGRLTGSQLTALQGLAQGLINRYGPSGTDADYRLVIHSPEALVFKAPRPPKPRPGNITTPVLNSQVNTVIRSQRRRGIGVGA